LRCWAAAPNSRCWRSCRNRLSLEELEHDLRSLPELKDAKLTVTPFGYRPNHDERARITHRVEITGDDSPGLIARYRKPFRLSGRTSFWLKLREPRRRRRRALSLAHGNLGPGRESRACLANGRQHRRSDEPEMPVVGRSGRDALRATQANPCRAFASSPLKRGRVQRPLYWVTAAL